MGAKSLSSLLPDTDTTGARHIAERIRSAVEQEQIPHEGNPHGVVTVSVGCAAVRPTTSLHSSLLLESADAAMYLAKQSGRNCVAR